MPGVQTPWRVNIIETFHIRPGNLLIQGAAMNRLWFTALTACLLLPGLVAAQEASLKWRIQLLTVDGNEGIDVADFNGDGKLDVAAGRNWYAAPAYTPRPLRTIEDWNGYVHSNGDYAYDVNEDGRTDIIAGDFIPTEVHWYENPGAKNLRLGKQWTKHVLVDTKASTNEGQLFEDIDGDGKPEWIVNSWAKNKPMLIWRLSTTGEGKDKKPTMLKSTLGVKGSGHGLGVGDLNGDGRKDILVGQGWYEQPAEKPFETTWKFHADWDWHVSIPVLVRDLDGDGRNDLIIGQGHNFGLHWWKQLEPAEDGKLQWEEKLIDKDWSQAHSLHMADLDGDGADELITGKRYYAHNGRDPGGEAPPRLYYYKWNAKSQTFTRHTIDQGSVGTGLQIRTADLNGDGRLDIAVAGKSGTYLLFNEGKGK